MSTLEIAEKRLRKRLDELKTQLEDVKEASKILGRYDGNQNQFIENYKEDLFQKETSLERSIGYIKRELEGPWMTETGRIEKGKYEGFYIVPLLEAFAASAKDFPSAMNMIGHGAKDHKMIAQDFSIYPSDDPNSNSAYGLLIEKAPKANWKRAMKISWDT